MSFVEVRSALIAQLVDNWPAGGPRLYTDKTEDIDLATAPDLFVRAVVEKTSANQVDISDDPYARLYGRLRATIFLRQHSGTETDVLELMDRLRSIFEFKTLGRIHVQAGMPGGEASRSGWYSDQIFFPFFADSKPNS